MIRPSHKSTKRKKSPQRVLGQRAGGAGGGGREEEAGLVAVPPPRGQQHREVRDRRDAAPAHGYAACGLCPLGRSAPFGAGRSEPGPEGRGAGPAASAPPGTTLDAVLVTRGPRGPSARAELSPAPPPPPTPRGGRGPGRSVGRSRHCARARCPRPGAASGVRQSGQSGGRHCPRTGRRQRPRPGGRAGDRKGFHPLSLPSKANPRGFPISANVTKQVATLVSSEGAQGRADRRG